MSDSAQSTPHSDPSKRRRGPGRPFAKGPADVVGRPRGGRAPRPVEERYFAITKSACSFEAWERIVKKAVENAENGDDVARAWLSKQLGLDAPQRIEQKITGDVQAPLVIEYVNDWRPGALVNDDQANPPPSPA